MIIIDLMLLTQSHIHTYYNKCECYIMSLFMHVYINCRCISLSSIFTLLSYIVLAYVYIKYTIYTYVLVHLILTGLLEVKL